MTIVQTLEALRKRVENLRNKQSLRNTSVAIGIGVNQLAAFLHGDTIALSTLQKIEAWCDQQEHTASLK